MTTVYIGSEWDHRQSNVCGYSLLVLRKITDENLLFDVIYGVIDDPEYVEMGELGGEIFSLVRGLKLLYNISFDSYISNELLIYYTCEKVGYYSIANSSPKKPILQYFQKMIQYYKSLMCLDFYYITESRFNFLSSLAKEYAKSGIYMYNEYRNMNNFVRDIIIPKESIVYNGRR